MAATLQNVTHIYGTRLVLKDISLEFKAGTVTLLAGANGAGKSTLLRIIAGLLSPTAGKVKYKMVHGEPISIGFLGHQTFIYPDLTALENLFFWQHLLGKKTRKQEVESALEQAELLAFAEEKAGGFSRGMSQRLSLARVFLQQPDLLLLDEPATGLDIRSAKRLIEAICRYREAGCAIVWISHNIEADKKYADVIAVIDKKKLTYTGAPEHFPFEEKHLQQRRIAHD